MDIDFVFPFVDGSDPEWIARHDLVCAQLNRPDQLSKPERFRDMGYLRYMLRGVAKFLPWVRRVYMIVESDSQVPKWIDRSWVRVIKHNEIMPSHILPTYNSSTIEMFLDRIPDLAEHFIYANDDMYPTAPSKPEDWFVGDASCVSFNTFRHDNATTMFRTMCSRQWEELRIAFKIPASVYYYRPQHDMSPMTLTDVKRAKLLLQNSINDHLEPFRNSAQHNQYIYSLIAYITNRTVPSHRTFKYIETKHDPAFVANVLSSGYQTICLNDVPAMDVEAWTEDYTVIAAFEQLFSEPCKYEK